MRCTPVLKPRCKIMLVGEAPGKDEEILGQPFVGAAGQELSRLLKTVNIDRSECSITNVFLDRPPNNKLDEHFFGPKKLGAPGIPPLRPGKYVKPEYAPELQRLRREIMEVTPNLVVALGAPACWALLGEGKISNRRGFCAESTLVPGQKVLPTYHPAAVLRQYDLRPIVLIDLMKARMEGEFPEIRRPRREIWIEPTITDLWNFYEKYLVDATRIGLDVETKRKQITCISFSPDKEHSLVIPFLDTRQPDWSYWRTIEEEIEAWKFVRHVCANHPCEKAGHNGLYDLQYLWRGYGIPVRNYAHDTMLLHHTLQPELSKSLGFLGSIYTNEAAWKEMRKDDEAEKPNE